MGGKDGEAKGRSYSNADLARVRRTERKLKGTKAVSQGGAVLFSMSLTQPAQPTLASTAPSRPCRAHTMHCANMQMCLYYCTEGSQFLRDQSWLGLNGP